MTVNPQSTRRHAHPESNLVPELPPLPSIQWGEVGARGPQPVATDHGPEDLLPPAEIVLFTWTMAEWSALDHVFCNWMKTRDGAETGGGAWQDAWTPMKRGFDAMKDRIAAGAPSRNIGAFGRWRRVDLDDGQRLLLFKSDLHLGTDGPDLPLIELAGMVAEQTGARTILSLGTAGGTRIDQCLGTAVVTNTACLELTEPFDGEPFAQSCYASTWSPDTRLLDQVTEELFVVTPVTEAALEGIAKSIAAPLASLVNDAVDPEHLRRQTQVFLGPRAQTHAVEMRPLLTENGYGVATTDGNRARWACLEMDDAVLAMVLAERDVAFGSIRNVSDPVLNTGLSDQVAHDWSHEVYATYGLHTSYNGALAAWALCRRPC